MSTISVVDLEDFPQDEEEVVSTEKEILDDVPTGPDSK